MTIDEIKKYKVIRQSRDAKQEFDECLDRGTYEVIDTFKNEFYELFVLYQFTEAIDSSGYIFITGDEFGWETGNCVNKLGDVFKVFLVTDEERAEIVKILKKNE